jgi:hypothetical protein
MDHNESRQLSKEEITRLNDQIRSTWGRTTHYWWPLDGQRPSNAEAFQTEYFQQELGHETLRDILVSHGVAHVSELIEGGDGRKISLKEFEPYYSGLESFWTSDSFDWVIYASHESSITVVGKWLLPAIQAAWPNGQARVWTTPFYQRPG